MMKTLTGEIKKTQQSQSFPRRVILQACKSGESKKKIAALAEIVAPSDYGRV